MAPEDGPALYIAVLYGYGGLTYMDYFSAGSCADSSIGGCGSTHGFSYGIEGGYGHTFAKVLVLRAVLGVGDYATTFEGTTTVCQTPLTCNSTTSSGSAHSVYLEPQAMVALSVGYVLVGVDAGVFYLPHIDQPVQSSTFASYRVVSRRVSARRAPLSRRGGKFSCHS